MQRGRQLTASPLLQQQLERTASSICCAVGRFSGSWLRQARSRSCWRQGYRKQPGRWRCPVHTSAANMQGEAHVKSMLIASWEQITHPP